jgi:siroheme synthase (precorrin-2 oxidase/ferrochelatase)
MSGIESQEERRRFLYRIAEDRTAEQLIKDGDEAGVRRRISSLLESWT